MKTAPGLIGTGSKYYVLEYLLSIWHNQYPVNQQTNYHFNRAKDMRKTSDEAKACNDVCMTKHGQQTMMITAELSVMSTLMQHARSTLSKEYQYIY